VTAKGRAAVIYRVWKSIGSRSVLEVTAVGAPAATPEAEADGMITAALAEVEASGFRADDVVRSRVYGRDAAWRTIASDARRNHLMGSRRTGSASFYDARRLPAGANVMVDLVALQTLTAGAAKTVREYSPAIFPAMFVTLDGMVFLSGNTDTSATLSEQLARIQARIGDALQASGTSWAKVVQVSAFFSRTLDAASVMQAINEHFPELACPVTLTDVVGYSAPGKLIEIEVTAYA
jgi:enamine deaminase RidA (YjgF/YER057c/UK114 family)